METIEIELYQYSELDEDAKEKAKNWYCEGAYDYEWYEFIYEEAQTIGLKITGFDCDRGTIEGELTDTVGSCCLRIIDTFGINCDAYKLAQNWYKAKGNRDKDAGKDFTYDLLQEYLSVLRKESEYMVSEDSISESMEANEYTFTKDGSRFG